MGESGVRSQWILSGFGGGRKRYIRHRHGSNARYAVSPSFANSTREFGALRGILIHLMGIFRKIGK